jgi:hypothetical protein
VISYSKRSKVNVLVYSIASFSKAIRGLILEAIALYSNIKFTKVKY